MSEVAASVLDNTDRMRRIDKSDMLSFCVNAAEHYGKASKTAEKISLQYSKPENVIVAGMGGSGIGGEILKDYARNQAPVPIEVSKDYTLPAYVNSKTLVLVVSYSGDTEETLSSFLDAQRRKSMVYCISSGGSPL